MDVAILAGGLLAILVFGFVAFGEQLADRLASVDDATQELLLEDS